MAWTMLEQAWRCYVINTFDKSLFDMSTLNYFAYRQFHTEAISHMVSNPKIVYMCFKCSSFLVFFFLNNNLNTGNSVWKVQEKPDYFCFGFFTLKFKSISYFSNNYFFFNYLVIFWLFLGIFLEKPNFCLPFKKRVSK